MTIVPHAVVGASVATLTGNIYLAFLFGLISHFLTDATPHFEPTGLVKHLPDGTKIWSPWIYVFVMAEFVLTILFFFYLKERIDFAMLVAGAFGGLLPDMIVNNPLLQKFHQAPIVKYIFWFHDKIHLELDQKYWIISVLTESVIIILALWQLFR